MLQLKIPPAELYDEIRDEFVLTKEYKLSLEHSLVSVSKWEAKWNKPFLAKGEKTIEETLDYIRCMTLTQNVPAIAYRLITNQHIEQISKYTEAPMTATKFVKQKNKSETRARVVTSEIIYYCMCIFNIPFECQKWHLNRLLTLINVCKLKNDSGKKMSSREVMEQNIALNEARRRAWKSNG